MIDTKQKQEQVNHPEHPIDARLRRIKDCILFFIVLVMTVGLFCFCVSIILDVRSLDDDKKWASIGVASIFSMLLGYLAGRSNK